MEHSHEIEFNPKSRSSIGENETLNRNSSEMISITRQQSIESLNTVDEYQNKSSENETNEIIHVVTMFRDEIKQTISENTRNMNSCEFKIDEIQQTMSNISSENTRNTNSFEMKIQDLKGYFDRQMSNVNKRVSHLAEGQAFPEIRQNIVNNNSQHPTGCGDNQYNHQSDKEQINGDSENMSRQNQQTYPYEQFTSHSHNSVNNSQFDPQIQYRNRQLHPSHSGVPSHASKMNMKPQYYDGTEDIDEYLNQFEIFTEINNWDYLNKSLYLASSLKRGARVILSELDSHERRDFHSSVKALNNRKGNDSVNKAKKILEQKLLDFIDSLKSRFEKESLLGMNF
ncbi:unnamed protein product [Mytilus coruscus]|uniref:Uncharacterized protein n=1 Tax=Mytilus coruscus TaxID=42192 RepID=A0A6J8DPD8_MYTCO|nr:unnamed protein product [Mytilus coruscus]